MERELNNKVNSVKNELYIVEMEIKHLEYECQLMDDEHSYDGYLDIDNFIKQHDDKLRRHALLAFRKKERIKLLKILNELLTVKKEA